MKFKWLWLLLLSFAGLSAMEQPTSQENQNQSSYYLAFEGKEDSIEYDKVVIELSATLKNMIEDMDGLISLSPI